MKLFILSLVAAKVEVHNDIRLTPCQRDHFKEAQINVKDDLVGPMAMRFQIFHFFFEKRTQTLKPK